MFHDKIKGLFNRYKPKIEVLLSELAKNKPKIDSKNIPEYKVCTREWCQTDASGNVTSGNYINGTYLIYYTKPKEK